MTAAVHKYPAAEDIEMPKGAKILHAGDQNGKPYLWALVDPDAEKEIRSFIVVGTGDVMPDVAATHIATFFRNPFVWHLFEATRG